MKTSRLMNYEQFKLALESVAHEEHNHEIFGLKREWLRIKKDEESLKKKGDKSRVRNDLFL